MFSLKVIDTDEFLDMPPTTQNLYFHLGMRADDDGFVSSPKKIMKIISSADDDMKVLLAKQFVIPFENGVCVIRHWKIHNYIQKDRYEETRYLTEKSTLIENNNCYEKSDCIQQDTKCIQNVSKMYPQVRVGKVRVGKSKVNKRLTTKVVKAKPTTYGNPLLNKFLLYLKEKTEVIDTPVKYQRTEGWILIRKMKSLAKEKIGQEPTDDEVWNGLKFLIDTACSDKFHCQHAGKIKYLYNNIGAIVKSKLNNKGKGITL